MVMKERKMNYELEGYEELKKQVERKKTQTTGMKWQANSFRYNSY